MASLKCCIQLWGQPAALAVTFISASRGGAPFRSSVKMKQIKDFRRKGANEKSPD